MVYPRSVTHSDPRPSRRARLIEVAIEMFTRVGVRRTSIEDIAAAAGVAKGSVYLEFRGKEELFVAAAEQVVREILAAAEAAVAREGALADRIAELLLAKFWRLYELVHARPHARELIETKDAVAAELFRVADDRFAALVSATLAVAAERGEWRPRQPYTTGQIAAVLLRAAHGNGYGGGALTAPAYRRRLQLAVELILAGAAGPPAVSAASARRSPRAGRGTTRRSSG